MAEQKARRPMVFARVEPVLLRRVEEHSARDFEGNDSMLFRRALETYLDLRDELGPRYEIVIGALRGGRERVPA